MFVLNCHFPQTHMNLTKPTWDKVQIIQNDLLLWQPKFLIQQQQADDLLSSSMRSSSIMSQSHERLSYPPPLGHYSSTSAPAPQQPQKTLFAINAVLSSGVWDIHTTDVNHYRLQFNEFRYFAAMKHLGQNENMTTLDIEELSLTDISNPLNPISLIYKTIPRTINVCTYTYKKRLIELIFCMYVAKERYIHAFFILKTYFIPRIQSYQQNHKYCSM
jgi:hypothetical protein